MVAGAVLVVVALAIVLWQQPWRSESTTATPAPPADAAQVLRTQAQALTDARSRAELRAAAGPGREARTWADDVWSAEQTLGVTGARWTYLRGGDAADRPDGSTSAVLQVDWQPARGSVLSRGSVASAQVELRLVPTRDGRFSIRSAHGHDQDRLPVWLAGRITLTEAAGAHVVTIDGGVPDVDSVRQTERAQGQVDRVVPRAQRARSAGRLLVVAPPTRSLAAQLLGRPARDVEQIAAVTTTLDGRPSTAPVIILNPALFATMDARAQQVVMSHEATHLLVGTSGNLPAWVAEGFADFVALHDDRAPLSLSAGQILRQVEDEGAPRALPQQSDFDGTTHGLGATYESAWMAFRMLAQREGTPAVVAFYVAVRDGTDVEVAARQHLGLSLAQITQQWRAYLTKSASIVS